MAFIVRPAGEATSQAAMLAWIFGDCRISGLLQIKPRGILISGLGDPYKIARAFPAVVLMVTEHTVHPFRAVKGDPGKFPVVVIGNARRYTDSHPGGNIGKRRI